MQFLAGPPSKSQKLGGILYLFKNLVVSFDQGRLQANNDYLARVPTSTSDTTMAYKRLSLGIETISILSAMEVPGGSDAGGV